MSCTYLLRLEKHRQLIQSVDQLSQSDQDSPRTETPVLNPRSLYSGCYGLSQILDTGTQDITHGLYPACSQPFHTVALGTSLVTELQQRNGRQGAGPKLCIGSCKPVLQEAKGKPASITQFCTGLADGDVPLVATRTVSVWPVLLQQRSVPWSPFFLPNVF